MAQQGYRIAILTDEARYDAFRNILELHRVPLATADGSLLHDPAFCTEPQWLKLLAQWDQAGVDILIVDDTALPDKEAMVAGLSYFLAGTRPKEGRLRPIFVSDMRRAQTDQIFMELASAGLYDLVIPGRDTSLSDKLVELIECPAKRGDVAHLIKMAPVFDPLQAPVPVDLPLTQRQQVKLAARGKSVIAVAGIMPRSGATNCAIVLARTLAMLGQEPALIVDKRTGSGFQKGYRYALAPDGKSYRVNGVDVFPGESPAVVSRKYSHVVLDVGYLSWGLQTSSAEDQQKFIEFNKADLQVVYLPCSSPADFEYLTKFFESRSAAELERYAIGVWGATDQLFALLQAKFRQKAPEVFMWNVDVYRWPLSLNEVSPAIVEVLRPVLPRGVAQRALQEAAEKAGASGAGESAGGAGTDAAPEEGR